MGTTFSKLGQAPGSSQKPFSTLSILYGLVVTYTRVFLIDFQAYHFSGLNVLDIEASDVNLTKRKRRSTVIVAGGVGT